MEPETKEMLYMKYYSHLFSEVYESNEERKGNFRRFKKRQERRFPATREANNNYKGKYHK